MLKQLTMFAVTAMAVSAFGDTLTFKSGSKITGEVVRIEGGKITFKSDDVGDLTIDANKVVEMTTDKANTILYNDKSTESAVVAKNAEGYTAGGKKLDMDNVKAVNPEEEKWHGSINASGTMARGNTVGEKASVLADVNRRWEKDRLTANFGYYFEQTGTTKDNKKKTEDRILLAGQEDHFWSNKFYSYVNGKYERDRLLDLDSRFRVGLGTGYQWLEGQNFEATGKWSFSQEAGMEYVDERWSGREDGSKETYCAFRYAHHLKWIPRWFDKMEVFHNLEYHPSVDDWSELYIINADAGFTVPVYDAWQLLGKFEWDYNSAPADSAKKSDLRYILGIGYKW